MVLEVVDLSVRYKGKKDHALKKVNFELEEKEILGIVGESGSGKTTLAFSILNLLPLDAKKKGKIIFEKKDIFSLKEKELEVLRGNKIGLIFQEPASSFNPVLSIGYQFEEILKEKLNIKDRNKRREIIFDAFKKVKLSDVERIIKSYPHTLSGGQLQRIAISMVISLKPKILIADEPTSSLDVTIESQIMHLFKELKEKLNLTVIFITHNLDLVKFLCDRVLVIYQGEVIEEREKEDIFRYPQHPYTQKLIETFKGLGE